MDTFERHPHPRSLYIRYNFGIVTIKTACSLSMKVYEVHEMLTRTYDTEFM